MVFGSPSVVRFWGEVRCGLEGLFSASPLLSSPPLLSLGEIYAPKIAGLAMVLHGEDNE